jgi:hypothetical protein
MSATRDGPFGHDRDADTKLPSLTQDQKEKLLLDIFLDESGECEAMLEKMFTRDTNESLFALHRLMTSMHYNYNRRYAEQLGDLEHMVYLQARIKTYRNEMAHHTETIRYLLDLSGVRAKRPRRSRQMLTLTADDMRELLEDDEAGSRPETVQGFAQELRAVLERDIMPGTGETFRDRQAQHRRMVALNAGNAGSAGAATARRELNMPY